MAFILYMSIQSKVKSIAFTVPTKVIYRESASYSYLGSALRILPLATAFQSGLFVVKPALAGVLVNDWLIQDILICTHVA